jgi:hypothetical protein
MSDLLVGVKCGNTWRPGGVRHVPCEIEPALDIIDGDEANEGTADSAGDTAVAAEAAAKGVVSIGVDGDIPEGGNVGVLLIAAGGVEIHC